MTTGLLPIGLPAIKDEHGKSASFDIPIIVFSTGTNSPLEQIVSSHIFRGGENAIEMPYDVKIVKQPLSKFYADQLAIGHVVSKPIDSPGALAAFLAAEDVSIVPPIKETQTIASMQIQYGVAKSRLSELEQNGALAEIDAALDVMEESIISIARLKVPASVSFFRDYLAGFKTPTHDHIAARLDYHRRVAAKYLQIMQGTTVFLVDESRENFDRKPTLRSARLLDALARNYIGLGLESEAEYCLSSAADAYRNVAESGQILNHRESAYASLIAINLLGQERDEASSNLRKLKSLGSPTGKEYLMEWACRNLPQSVGLPEELHYQFLQTMDFQNYHHPDLLDIMNDRVAIFLRGPGQDVWAPSLVDSMEAALTYSKKTILLNSESRREGEKTVFDLTFNQEPCFQFSGQTAYEPHNGYFRVSQEIDSNVGRREINAWRKNPYRALSSDIDRYMARVPDIPGDIFRLDLTTIAYGPKGRNPIRMGV